MPALAVEVRPGVLSREPLHPTRAEVFGFLRSADAHVRYCAYDCIPQVGGDGEEAITYVEYLQTEAWRAYRAAVFERQGGECVLCPRDATHCHHRTYVNLGWEDDADCVGLCADCHGQHHAPRPSRRKRSRS